MPYCLIPSLADKFKKAVISGEVNPEKLTNMTSKQRNEFFSKLLGEKEARNVNSLFESKLLLKNQALGMVNWAKTLTGIKPEVKRDILATIQGMVKKGVLTPEKEAQFLEDLASKRLGADVSFEEAKQITKLSNEMAKAKENLVDGASKKYGVYKASMEQLLSDMKLKGKTTTAYEKVKDVAGASKGMKASLDNSGLLRQGWKTVWTNPKEWGKNAVDSFKYIRKTFKGDDVMLGIKSELYGRKYSIDGTYKKMRLDIGDMEEAFPSTLPEKIPVFKKLYKASENAYTGFLYKLRADIADTLLDTAKKQGIDIADEMQLKSIGKMVNSLTGRGNLGKFEVVGKDLNNFFFSPKFLKSNIDFLTAHQFQKDVTPFVRKQAAQNLAKVVAGTGAVLLTANTLMPGSVEWNPKSSKFGKIKVGDTTFDVTGGMGSIVTLVSRMLTGETKTSAGSITKLNSGDYGAMESMDVFWNFWEGKLSPTASLAKNLLNRSDFMGKKLTPQGALKDLFLPLPIDTGIELYKNENSAPFLVSMILEGLGVSANTYPIGGEKDWTEKPGVEIKQFQESVSKEDFKKANKEFNSLVNEKVAQIIVDERYLKMSNDDKKKTITKAKEVIKDEIFKKYGFKYK